MPLQGREVVIVEAVRTPIGRDHKEKGYYKDTHPAALLARSYGELIDRTGIDPHEVDTVIAGCVQQFGEQAFNIGRNAWLQEGLPIDTSATTLIGISFDAPLLGREVQSYRRRALRPERQCLGVVRHPLRS